MYFICRAAAIFVETQFACRDTHQKNGGETHTHTPSFCSLHWKSYYSAKMSHIIITHGSQKVEEVCVCVSVDCVRHFKYFLNVFVNGGPGFG